MIEKKAVVTRTENGRVWLNGETSSACGGCGHNASCATAALAQAMPTRELEMNCDQPFAVGEEVSVALEDSQLLLASFMLYVLPLLIMLLGVTVAEAILPQPNAQVWLVPVSLLSLWAGFWLVKCLHRYSAINPCIK